LPVSVDHSLLAYRFDQRQFLFLSSDIFCYLSSHFFGTLQIGSGKAVVESVGLAKALDSLFAHIVCVYRGQLTFGLHLRVGLEKIDSLP